MKMRGTFLSFESFQQITEPEGIMQTLEFEASRRKVRVAGNPHTCSWLGREGSLVEALPLAPQGRPPPRSWRQQSRPGRQACRPVPMEAPSIRSKDLPAPITRPCPS